MADRNSNPAPLCALDAIRHELQEGLAITRLAYDAVNAAENGSDDEEQLPTARIGLEVALAKLRSVDRALDELHVDIARRGARPDAAVVRLMRQHEQRDAAVQS